ncbi:hypothetical protein [Lacrimispora sp. 38-1]|uniref:hypothetical protein n=1 Tax=Lacrimispora sp. 38-1 TaxID=3125778 RepID=UPI003CF7B6FD
MAECIVLKGGGGTDLDVVTAGKPDVLSGKVIVDKNGEPLTGTMPNRGAVSQVLGVNGTYTIPEGYHNGSGKVTQNIPIQGADVSGTDRAWATNISCWEGVACLGVRNAHYLNGVNWIQGNIPNFNAGNIKKGVSMGGLVGTFEGYVPTATDLYLRGNNISQWYVMSGSCAFDSGQISIMSHNVHLHTGYNINLAGFKWLNIQGYGNYGAGTIKGLRLYKQTGTDSYLQIGFLDLTNFGSGNYAYGFDLSAQQVVAGLRLVFEYMEGAAYRIWLA